MKKKQYLCDIPETCFPLLPVKKQCISVYQFVSAEGPRLAIYGIKWVKQALHKEYVINEDEKTNNFYLFIVSLIGINK